MIFPILLCCGLDMGVSPWPQMPPPQYDHAYHGHLTIKTARTTQEIYRLCHDNFARACAYPGNGSCTIILPANGDPQILSALRRHEIAHCNGWRHSGDAT